MPSESTVSQNQESGLIEVELNLKINGPIESDPLTVLRKVNEGIKNLEHTVRSVVHVARQQRLTWEEIGDALGVTRQSAWERFAVD